MSKKIIGWLCLLAAGFIVLVQLKILPQIPLWLILVSLFLIQGIVLELGKKSFFVAGLYLAVFVFVYNEEYGLFDSDIIFSVCVSIALMGLGLKLLLTDGQPQDKIFRR